MEETIRIDSGTMTIPVQVDNNPPVKLVFNPNDRLFAERLHKFYFEVKEKLIEMNAAEQELSAEGEDENGMPLNVDKIMAAYEDINKWLRERIDQLLGKGTAQAIYGDTIYTGERVDVYIQLFDGLFKVAGKARGEMTSKYVRKSKE